MNPESGSFPVSPHEDDLPQGRDEGVSQEKDIELDIEEERSEGGRIPRTLRGPGTPTQEEVDQRNTIHIPFRSWCPARVAGRARGRRHKKKDNQWDTKGHRR